MEKINFSGPINSLSFGNVSYNMLKSLYKMGKQVALFPIGKEINLSVFDKMDGDFKDWVTDSFHSRYENLSKESPTIKMWHLNGSEDSIGNRNFLYTFYETDEPTKSEINICNLKEKCIFSSSFARDKFKEAGCENSEYIPIGFDDDFHKTDKSYLDDIILFGLIGKFEKRKHTAKIIKLWAEKYGDDPRYQLACCVTNPFFKKEQMLSSISQALGGKRYKNINFLPYINVNSEMNELYNAVDINLSGLSGAEGWNLPAFNSACLGRWPIVLNATSHKDWATKDNSILIEPSSQEDVYDEIFFAKGDQFNQGKINCFTDEEFYNATETAIKKCRSNNVDGESLRETFSYDNTIKQIISLIES